MNDQKISVSLDEVNSPQVDAELHRQDIAGRMAEHQQRIRVNFENSGGMGSGKGGVFRKAMVYMTLFGLIFSILAWGLGELASTDNHPWYVARGLILNFYKEYPNATTFQFKQFLEYARQNVKGQANNPYLQERFWNQPSEKRKAAIDDARTEAQILDILWFIFLAIPIAVGLAIAEPCVSGNFPQAAKHGGVAAILGAVGGIISAFSLNHIYQALLGEGDIFLQRVFARAVGWGLLGLFVAVSPGICLKSWKKFLLGCAGGVLGGFFGGCLFDLLGTMSGSGSLSRFVNIVGIGVGAAFATVLLENIAKQGWLKVAAGVIAGKQFILYRNPTVIGSSPKCEIYLFKDPQIAPRHAAVNNHNGDFVITSIDGAPLYVNDAPERQRRLSTGDRIRIGNTVFVFEAKAIKKQG